RRRPTLCPRRVGREHQQHQGEWYPAEPFHTLLRGIRAYTRGLTNEAGAFRASTKSIKEQLLCHVRVDRKRRAWRRGPDVSGRIRHVALTRRRSPACSPPRLRVTWLSTGAMREQTSCKRWLSWSAATARFSAPGIGGA